MRDTDTGPGLFRIQSESVALTDRDTVQRWLRELRPGRAQRIFIHRSWGTLVAIADRRGPVNVLLTDGETTWFATIRGTTNEQPLPPEQIEHVMLDALTSPAPPDWPEWRVLV
ncbi:hypothetical protein E1218_23045 [Kribbella turkmenica]|uniref:Uncharacterized protein n=2 Tax=Kribbella turkmenica TaxID=2530375 RepID=A0A4R4WS37_9ACTN|nr:hypothetical protein E1218_23045 [Kribbella turkmenica]